MINRLPDEEKPREKAISKGIESLNNLELMALIIRSGGKGNDVYNISASLLGKLDNLKNAYNTNIDDIKSIKGISTIKAIEIMALIEISKRINNLSYSTKISYNNPEEIFNMYKTNFVGIEQEKMIILFLNNKNQLMKEVVLFTGGKDFISIDVNMIFTCAYKIGASRFICLHNHISGDSNPSKNDIITTNKIVKMSFIANIEILDHIIIGNNYYSFKEHNLI